MDGHRSLIRKTFMANHHQAVAPGHSVVISKVNLAAEYIPDWSIFRQWTLAPVAAFEYGRNDG